MAARRESASGADPLYWARARAAEREGTSELDRAGYDAGRTSAYDRLSDVTEEHPSVDDATTVDLPAVPSTAETVDYRDHPLALVGERRPERSALARRSYTGRHRAPQPALTPPRLGLST